MQALVAKVPPSSAFFLGIENLTSGWVFRSWAPGLKRPGKGVVVLGQTYDGDTRT